jgi:hypothetical protein
VEIIIEDQLDKLTRKYNNSGGKPVLVNFKNLTNKMLNGFPHNDKLLHYIHTYPGRISPSIAFYFLSLNEFKSLKGYVLDPFAGSGTILLESLINPVLKRPALGVEINPLARLISKVKTTVLNEEEINKSLIKIKNIYEKVNKKDYEIPSFTNIDLWFSKKAKLQLAKLKFSIAKVKLNDNYRDFFWLSFSKIIRKVSKADPHIPPPVVLKPIKYKNNPKEYQKLKAYLKAVENPNIWLLFEKSVKENSKLSILNKLTELVNNKIDAKIISDNAKDISIDKIRPCGNITKNGGIKLSDESIDIILTSPPYLTAQKYIRSTKLELLWLGYSSEELSKLERKTIGSEYVTKSTPICLLNIESIDKLLEAVYKKSKPRGIMVYEYFANMKIVLSELYRVLKKEGYAIFVMGDNVVLKKHIKTYNLLTNLAESIGFKELLTLKDKIRNRSMITKRNGTGGIIRNEFIIILKK